MLKIIGAAVGSGGPDIRASEGPDAVFQSAYWQKLIEQGRAVEWINTFREELHANKVDILCEIFEKLASETASLTEKKERFCVIGGDHSAAIGTWSGVAAGLNAPLGLIWIDAHKDAHTFDTSPSGNIHGMPVATLLGFGDKQLTELYYPAPKILPQNLCLIGVRSFEPEEHDLLESLNVKTYDMDAVKKLGMSVILQEAHEHVSRHTIGYGITLDIDSVDPEDAPAVSTPEPGGIRASDLLKALTEILPDPKQVGFEIMEFNPSNDKDRKTEKFIFDILEILTNSTNI